MKVTLIGIVSVLRNIPDIDPPIPAIVPDAGIAVIIPAGVVLVHVNEVPGTPFVSPITIFTIATLEHTLSCADGVAEAIGLLFT